MAMYFLMGFLMVAAFLYTGIESLNFQMGARVFPLFIAAVGLLATSIALWQEYRNQQRAKAAHAGMPAEAEVVDDAPDNATTRQVIPHYLHVGLFLVLLLTIGFPLAAGLYTFAFITASTWKDNRTHAVLRGAALGLLAYGMGIGLRIITQGNLQ